MSFTTELRVPGDAAFAPLVKRFVADAASRAGLSLQRRRALAASAARGFAAIVGEAIVREREPIGIVASCSPAQLAISFHERGLPMDDSYAYRDPRWKGVARGVDAAHWRSHGTAGCELRLEVRRPRAVSGAQTEAAPPVPAVAPAPEQPYTIRRFEPRDAAGVARAFYLTYGYAYDLPAVYEPERLIEMNASGRYVSIVALAQDGEVAGHYALARESGAQIADGCGAIVLPAHRGRNLLDRLRSRAEEEAAALGLVAYYTEPVTDHPRTQRASERFGAKACGITLGEAPRSFVARDMELSTTTQRQSCMLYVKPLQARASRRIYAPPRHREIVAAIYRELGLPVEHAQGASPQGRGRFNQSVARSDATGTIAVDAIGTETAAMVRQAVADMRAAYRLGAIYAALPLEDPATPALCDALESLGMYFSGVGPWMLGGKDALRLQLTLTPLDLDALVIAGEFGRRLLGYIAAERDRSLRQRFEARGKMP